MLLSSVLKFYFALKSAKQVSQAVLSPCVVQHLETNTNLKMISPLRKESFGADLSKSFHHKVIGLVLMVSVLHKDLHTFQSLCLTLGIFLVQYQPIEHILLPKLWK